MVGLWSFLTYHHRPVAVSEESISSMASMGSAGYEDYGYFDHVNGSISEYEVLHEDKVVENQTSSSEGMSSASSCPFLVDASHSEWAYKAPVLLILACNMVFLIYIMTVVICKLRSETTERHRQHWRAVKALLVIFPLLGICYIITLVGPTEGTPGHWVFQHVRALLLSLQVLRVCPS